MKLRLWHLSFGIAFLMSAWMAGVLIAGEAGGTYEAEKAKALTQPYANDLGPDKIDVSGYAPEFQKAYKEVLQVKCIKCHAASRPLNSQFVEVEGKKEEKEGILAALKKSEPDLFAPASKHIWQMETNIWERYVKRMMAKPGCDIKSPEGKAVWQFLVYDSARRKLGKNKAAWKAHREKLLAEFKQKHPKRYEELYASK